MFNGRPPKRHTPTLRILGLLCALSLSAASGCAGEQERFSDDRLQAVAAPDLQQQTQLAADHTPIEVIVQYDAAAGRAGCPLPRTLDMPSQVRAIGATVQRHLPRMGQLVATVPAGMLRRLAACEAVTRLSPDRPLGALGKHKSNTEVPDAQALVADLLARTTGAAAVQSGSEGAPITGQGVTVAVLDSGVFSGHQALKQGAKKSDWWVGQVAKGPDGGFELKTGSGQDPYGHGTMVAGALIGRTTGFAGVAPGVRVLSVQLLDNQGVGKVSDAIAALDWLIEHRDALGVRVVNFSLTSPPLESYSTDPLGLAVQRAVKEGIVVVAAAGNLGRSDGETVYGGVGSPANHPAVITVGAVDPAGTVARSDDTVAWFSSRGPTLIDGVTKPDLVAPGVDLVLPVPPGSALVKRNPELVADVPVADGAHPFLSVSGTSFAAPAVAGTIALMLERNPGLTPTHVKAIVQLTAQRMPGVSPLAVGTGLLNTLGAVQLAGAWNPDPSLPVGADNLLSPLPEPLANVIEGEVVLWGTGIIWNGLVAFQPWWFELPGAWLFVGNLTGTGIIWNGLIADLGQVFWLDYNVAGTDLLRVRQEAWQPDVLWGTGIIWNGLVAYSPSASFSFDAISMWWGNLLSPWALTTALQVSGPLVTSADESVSLSSPDLPAGAVHVPSFGPAPAVGQ